MKRFLLPLLALLLSFSAQANFLKIVNNTACDYWVVLYSDAGSGCGQVRAAMFQVPANNGIFFANTAAVNWNASTPNCPNPGPDFDGVSLFEGPVTSSGNLGFVGPHYGWPTSFGFATSNPCNSGAVHWTPVGGGVVMDIN